MTPPAIAADIRVMADSRSQAVLPPILSLVWRTEMTTATPSEKGWGEN